MPSTASPSVKRFALRTPIYRETAAYGHLGRESKEVVKIFNKGRKNEKKVKVVLFPWERLNAIEATKKAFGLSGAAAKSTAKASTKTVAKKAEKPSANGKVTDKKGKQLMLLA